MDMNFEQSTVYTSNASGLSYTVIAKRGQHELAINVMLGARPLDEKKKFYVGAYIRLRMYDKEALNANPFPGFKTATPYPNDGVSHRIKAFIGFTESTVGEFEIAKIYREQFVPKLIADLKAKVVASGGAMVQTDEALVTLFETAAQTLPDEPAKPMEVVVDLNAVPNDDKPQPKKPKLGAPGPGFNPGNTKPSPPPAQNLLDGTQDDPSDNSESPPDDEDDDLLT